MDVPTPNTFRTPADPCSTAVVVIAAALLLLSPIGGLAGPTIPETPDGPVEGSLELARSTFFGGSGRDGVGPIELGPGGNLYVGGSTWSTDFPTKNAFQAQRAGTDVNDDAYVAKFTPDGELVYSTYLGGNGWDGVLDIAIGADGSAYAVGIASSDDFPTRNAFQADNASKNDGFVAKLSPGGDLEYSTYLGGSSKDWITGADVNATGHVHFAGGTRSTDLPTRNAYQSNHAGSWDGFVGILSPSGDELVYSSYLGGGGKDQVSFLELGRDGETYLAGYTTSEDFPTRHAYQDRLAKAPAQGRVTRVQDAFVTQLSPGGGTLEYSTYLGGTGMDWTQGLAVDGTGSVYVSGDTASADFPTRNAVQLAYGGGYDGFVTRFTPTGDALIYSTYLGGSADDSSGDVELDAEGSAYVVGSTLSDDFPTEDPYQIDSAGLWEAVAAKIAPTGGDLAYSTYLGGTGLDFSYDLAVDPDGSVYVGGATDSEEDPDGPSGQDGLSTGFPTTGGAYQETYAGGTSDGFVTKLVHDPDAVRVPRACVPRVGCSGPR